MKKLILSLLFVPVAGLLLAQEPPKEHHRSAEEKALKQTEMIVRELNIDDSAQYHQLFDMHLKYARKYENGCTRAQWLEEIEAMNKDLKTILTKEQYNAFMNKQVNEGPHGPKPQVGRFGGHHGPPDHPGFEVESGARPGMPEPQPTIQPKDHL